MSFFLFPPHLLMFILVIIYMYTFQCRYRLLLFRFSVLNIFSYFILFSFLFLTLFVWIYRFSSYYSWLIASH